MATIHYITANASHPVVIKLKKQRVIFNAYHKNSMAQSSLVDKYCHISNTSKHKVLAALPEDHSMISIAREHNLSVNTVQRVLESCSSKFDDNFECLPEHLAFDEFRILVRSFVLSA